MQPLADAFYEARIQQLELDGQSPIWHAANSQEWGLLNYILDHFILVRAITNASARLKLLLQLLPELLPTQSGLAAKLLRATSVDIRSLLSWYQQYVLEYNAVQGAKVIEWLIGQITPVKG